MDNQSAEGQSTEPEVFRSLGFITRMLHDALSELGLDKKLEDAVSSLPDARSRLAYISRVSGESADKVISQVEGGKAQQHQLSVRAAQIRERLMRDPVQAVATGGVLEFIEDVQRSAHDTDEIFTEILTAQSFHDLTSQVIQKVTGLASNLETELVKLLVELSPEEKRQALPEERKLNGPVIDTGDANVMTSQDQVDNLLESLGF
ncbi:MAG: protein phosphatase CheZ [Burkholderiaceae bacterium]